MLRPSVHPRRFRPRSRRSPEARNRREETALSSVRLLSAAQRWLIYSLVRAVNSEGFMPEAGSVMEAVVPNPCPALDMPMVPPFAPTKVDAIQKPRPDPGMLA